MKNQESHDNLYKDPEAPPAGCFSFDDRVAKVFTDMIHRSVPGYPTVVNMISVLASRYAQAGSRCYDLGCSLGASTVAISRGIHGRHCRIIGVDNSPEMLSRARRHIEKLELQNPIELICADALETDIAEASLVVLNFTLQFIAPERRLELLTRIRRGLKPAGILVLSEKIAFEEHEQASLQNEMHHAFKRANGYDELEISRKRSALEQVLIPETLGCHQQRLLDAGFRRSDLWFQCFNFVSLVARL